MIALEEANEESLRVGLGKKLFPLMRMMVLIGGLKIKWRELL